MPRAWCVGYKLARYGWNALKQTHRVKILTGIVLSWWSPPLIAWLNSSRVRYTYLCTHSTVTVSRFEISNARMISTMWWQQYRDVSGTFWRAMNLFSEKRSLKYCCLLFTWPCYHSSLVWTHHDNDTPTQPDWLPRLAVINVGQRKQLQLIGFLMTILPEVHSGILD